MSCRKPPEKGRLNRPPLWWSLQETPHKARRSRWRRFHVGERLDSARKNVSFRDIGRRKPTEVRNGSRLFLPVRFEEVKFGARWRFIAWVNTPWNLAATSALCFDGLCCIYLDILKKSASLIGWVVSLSRGLWGRNCAPRAVQFCETGMVSGALLIGQDTLSRAPMKSQATLDSRESTPCRAFSVTPVRRFPMDTAYIWFKNRNMMI